MSIQEFSDGTLPDYFHNLWRKNFMTEEKIKSKKKKQLKKIVTSTTNIRKKTNNEYNYITKTEKEEQ